MNNQIKAVASREEFDAYCAREKVYFANETTKSQHYETWQAAIECMQSLSMGDAADREAVGLGTSDNTANLASRQTSPANQQDELLQSVAKSIYQANNTHCYEWSELATSTQEWYLEQADAAIRCMSLFMEDAAKPQGVEVSGLGSHQAFLTSSTITVLKQAAEALYPYVRAHPALTSPLDQAYTAITDELKRLGEV